MAGFPEIRCVAAKNLPQGRELSASAIAASAKVDNVRTAVFGQRALLQCPTKSIG